MSNTTINFNAILIGADGKTFWQNKEGREITNGTLAQALSEFLGTETEGKTLKLWGWHKTLQVGDPLILDDSDKKDLRSLIEESKRLFICVKGQLIDIIDSAK